MKEVSQEKTPLEKIIEYLDSELDALKEDLSSTDLTWKKSMLKRPIVALQGAKEKAVSLLDEEEEEFHKAFNEGKMSSSKHPGESLGSTAAVWFSNKYVRWKSTK